MDRGSWYYTGGSDQNHPKEKVIQKGKMIAQGGFINSWEKRIKKQGRKGKICPTECRVPENSKER